MRNMQRFVLPLLIANFIIISNIGLCSSAKVPDDGYINPPPPPVDGYDVPKDGYDTPEYEEIKGRDTLLFS